MTRRWARHLAGFFVRGYIFYKCRIILKNWTRKKEIASFRAAGLKVALDDFGTGFAPLTHLISIPVDVIKIDNSFVDRLGPGDVGVGIVKGILHIAKRLGIKVVAEAIEAPEQAKRLLTNPCTFGQGYLYAKSLSPQATLGLLMLSQQTRDDERQQA